MPINEECAKCLEPSDGQHTVNSVPLCAPCRAGTVKTLTCNCCGQSCKGRQWWNRDKGYGICPACAKKQAEQYGIEQLELDNGKTGVYHSL